MLITLTTDFGLGSAYVAALKGVILGLNPAATIVDVSHSIPPQDVRAGSILLAEALPWFPAAAIHVAVVDPGVGTDRPLIYAELGPCRCLAPDNGLLSQLAERYSLKRIIRLTTPEFWLPEISSTFHGRDILAPVAARLSLGLDPAALGEPLDDLQRLSWPQALRAGGTITGEIIQIDHFGNLMTNIPTELLEHMHSGALAACGNRDAIPLVQTYGDRPPGETIALIGSSGRLEIAVVNGSAATLLNAREGSAVVVTTR